MRWSRRTAFAGEDNPLAVAIAEARRAGRSPTDLTVSNPTRAGLPYDRDAILAPLSSADGLRYAPESLGTREARRAVAETFGVPAGRVVITASTSEAYAFLLKVLCDPGDRVLTPQPSYPLLAHLAKLEGVALSPYDLRFDGRFYVDPASVRQAMGFGARAVLAVSPNNPTGSYLDADDLRALDAAGVPVVVDEVFHTYPLEGAAATARETAFSMQRPRVVVGGLSKLAGLPQMKVGWILVGGDDAFAKPLLQRLEVVADAYLSVSTPAQLALPLWLARREQTVSAIRTRTRTNLETLRALLPEDSAISVPEVEGGWSACLRVPRTRSDESWALRLLEADDVLVQPGYFYDFEDGWLVVSLLTPADDFRTGATKLIARIDQEA
ncbi:MAG: pyridoxal phosphate-dependent aminotransferase [Deltaproteobacteria bacterium]|nr:pyridoxal phosphate-dependent aminotransferase [Deltaproteobacteria bacterium]